MSTTVTTTTHSPYSCAICLDTLPSYHPTTTLPCDHIFHRDCLSQWHPNPCPLCRIESNEERPDYSFPEYTPPSPSEIMDIPKGTTVPLSTIDITLVKTLTGYTDVDETSKEDLVADQHYLFNSNASGHTLYVGRLVQINSDSIEFDQCMVITRRRGDTFNICYTCNPLNQKFSFTDNYYLYKLNR